MNMFEESLKDLPERIENMSAEELINWLKSIGVEFGEIDYDKRLIKVTIANMTNKQEG